MVERVECGCPGHCIIVDRCRFRRHTQVGTFRVSTIGDYYPGERGSKRETLGGSPNSYFETMVFRTSLEPDEGNEGCGCRAVVDWCEIDGERYPTAGEAQAGHERYVEKYLAEQRT